MSETIAYSDGETALNGIVYRPSGTPRAAVAVYPTIMNQVGVVLDKAQALADAGYLAMVADFYGKQPENFDQSREFVGEIRATPEDLRRRIRMGLKALVEVPGSEGLPLLAIGFCLGGRAVLELAREGAPLEAVVSFHGLLDTELPAEPGKVAARILVCHGDADPMVPRSLVVAFWEEMDAAGANWHFHSYSGVKHGFTNPNSPAGNPAVDYDASADRQSWAAMHELFEEVLG
ncbi:dienelactone hydrolase family protein [Altererythrobacter salegens]|uniref:Dienelactone hydrolase family protein n=1 Tax=Croceibacterium salegens TaxID=1737568 RepID=A0A6I4SVU2_9SPHN|nr:dienelactone hydrolase family protein [Croceibacterium salegens]MXO59658.1 dienelactone hydrolase family protein [Croceibacterium salegens]